MKLEVLRIDDCSSWREAGERVALAARAAGLADAVVEFVPIRTAEQAAAVPFAGSPTILIDGVDAFPSDGRTVELACRVYRVGERLAGVPSVEQLTAVLRDRAL